MDESANKEAFLDQLRSVRDALEVGRGEEALEVLLEIREAGFVASNLDRQIERLREDPDEQALAWTAQWVQNLIGQMQRPDDPFGSLEEVTGADAEPLGADQLMPMSESSDVGLELQQTPGQPDAQGAGTDVHSVVEEVESRGDSVGFDQESQPSTRVGEDVRGGGFGGESDVSDVEGMDGEEGFEELPSVDFAVVESEADDVEEDLEPLDAPADGGLEGEEATEANEHSSGEAGASGEEEVVAGIFDEEDAGEESIEDLFNQEPTSVGEESTGSGFELQPGSGEDESPEGGSFSPEAAERSGQGREFDPSEGDGSDEWSALDAFESSELEADSSDFEFDSEPETAAGDQQGGNQPPPIPESERGVGEKSEEEDLSFGFDGPADGSEKPSGDDGSVDAEGEGAEDPNQTRQPFSDNSEAAEQFAREAFEDSPDQKTKAGSVEELVGEEHAALFGGQEEGSEESGPSPFADGESTAQSDAPEGRSGVGSGFENEEETAKNERPEDEIGAELDDEEEFDLGFENPGEDDSAGFEFEFGGEAEGDEASETPIPDADLSDLAEATGPESGGEAPLEKPADPGDEGQADDSSARYSAGESESSAQTAEGDEALSVETEENDALSDEEFFQLADELSDSGPPEESAEESSPNPTPHRGEPVVPVDEQDSQAEGAAPSSPAGGTHIGQPGSDPSSELSGINPNASGAPDSTANDDGSGTGSYSSVPHDSSEADEQSRDLAAGAVRLINEAERLFEKGNLESAHDLVQSVLDGSPESERAKSLLERIEAEQQPGGDEPEGDEPAATGEHRAIDANKPPPLDAVPKSEVNMAEVADRDFDHRFGFILSLVDGTVTVQDICELSSMSRQETLEVLADMVAQSVISVDE